ncbi:MAG: GAF domain-containing protein [Cytophagales bacterium]
MKNQKNLIIYFILSVISLSLVIDLVFDQTEIHFQKMLFPVKNPVVIISLIIAPIIYSLIIFLFTSIEPKVKIDETNSQKIDFEEKQNTVEEQLTNRFLNNVNELTDKISKENPDNILGKFCETFQISQALIFEKNNYDLQKFNYKQSFAYIGDKENINQLTVGEGLNGQAILNKEPLYITDIPENYMKITSGLGQSSPNTLILIPLKNESGDVIKLLEVSSFSKYNTEELKTIYNVAQKLFV